MFDALQWNGPLGKHIELFGTPCMIVLGLSGNGPSRIWEKATNVAYQDVLRGLNSDFLFFIFLWGGGVKGLIVNRSNLVVVCGRSSLK